jgi:hypothetical protein
LQFFGSGFTDRAALDFQNLRFYGGLFDALIEGLARASPLPPHETRHLVTALAGLTGIAGAWRFARHLGGPVAGLTAAVFVAAVPTYYGHMFINPKDIPFAAGYIWTLYLTARTFETFPKIPIDRAIGLGVVLGLTLAIWVGGVLLIGYLGLLAAILIARRGNDRPVGMGLAAFVWDEVKRLLRPALCVFVPAYLIMITVWPWALINPVHGPLYSLWRTMRFSWDHTTLLLGEYVRAMDLPAHYIPVYLGVKLPEFLLVAAVALLPLAVTGTRRAWAANDPKSICAYIVLWLGVFFPPSCAIIMQSVNYDAIRHFIFIIPPLVVLCGIEAGRIVSRSASSRRSTVAVCAAVMSLAIAHSVWTMVNLHPYQYISYNALAGNVRGVDGRFEMDYWATSYKKASELLMEVVEREETAQGRMAAGRDFAVWVCGPVGAATPYLGKGFRPAIKVEEADFLIGHARWHCDEAVIAPIIADVRRQGVRLSVVRDLRNGFEVNPLYDTVAK